MSGPKSDAGRPSVAKCQNNHTLEPRDFSKMESIESKAETFGLPRHCEDCGRLFVEWYVHEFDIPEEELDGTQFAQRTRG